MNALLLAAALTVGTPTFSQLADDAVATIMHHWYIDGSRFRECSDCATWTSADWGADSLVEVLYERWLLTRDPAVAATFARIVAGEPGNTLGGFSDVPMWDAVAAIRAYDVTHDPRALDQAEREYDALAESKQYALEPCRAFDAQIRDGGGRGLRTLETDSNRILAAVSIAQRTTDADRRQRTLSDAVGLYAAVRTAFLDRQLPLYTVYLFPAGDRCVQLPQRQFFASVNGRMIEAGLALAAATHGARYADDARATARAVDRLSDARGIFVDQQAQNDIVEPLVVAMLALARNGDANARDWIVRNALAAASARAADGSYARFFDGPPPPAGATVSFFETNGGLGLMVAAAAFAPNRRPVPDGWANAQARAVSITTAPARYEFRGSGIALIGALPRKGDPACRPLTVGNCEGGRVGVRVDGRRPADEIGIWQGKALVASDATVLFAWRWPRSGHHVVDLDPVAFNPKQGGTAVAIRQAVILP
jgi:hypothetical protein